MSRAAVSDADYFYSLAGLRTIEGASVAGNNSLDGSSRGFPDLQLAHRALRSGSPPGIEGYNCARRSIWMARSIRIAPKAIAGPVSSRRCRGQIRHPKSIAKLSGYRSSRAMRSSGVAAIRGAHVAYRSHNEQEADGGQDSLLRRRLHHGFVCRQGVRPRIERPSCYARACRMCHGFGSKTGALQQK
jgi:hypothetical protein